MSLGYLLDAQRVELFKIEFRTKANITSRERASVEIKVLEWIERYLQIELILELDSASWQRPVADPYLLEAASDAEKLAMAVRDAWRLGLDPISNMTELLEEKGLKVLTVSLPQRVSGFTCLVKSDEDQTALPVPVIVVNNQPSLERRRLTLAHELAHCLIDNGNPSSKEEEKAATMFAGAFLIPREHFLREVGKRRNALGYKELVELKQLYRVSGAAILMRLRQLDVISDATLTYAFQSFARNWRTQEPEQLELEKDRGQFERARRFERLCYRAFAEGLISLAKTSELLQLPVSDIEAGMKGPQSTHADRHKR